MLFRPLAICALLILSSAPAISLAEFMAPAADKSAPTTPAVLVPFTATYEARFSGIGVTAVRRLSGKQGNWRLDFTADSMFADIREYSRFTENSGALTPGHYEYHKTGLGKDRHTALNFEDKNHRVINLNDESRSIENAPENIHDKISYQIQLALDIAAGKKPMAYQVADGKKIREYTFKIAGEETIQTDLGAVKTIKVQRVRQDNSDKVTNIWFAPQWNYALVKLMQQEEDGKNYQITLTKLSINGKPVINK